MTNYAVLKTLNIEAQLGILNSAASLWWRSHAERDRLRNMTMEERAAMPDYAEQLADADAGTIEANNEQNTARAHLERINALPAKWRKWPERRSEPRPDIW